MNEISKPRYFYLDVMRIVACFLVVITHSAMANREENGIYLAITSFICSPSSEMFLMLSGAILLPVHTSLKNFYQRRFLKLLPPMAVWSVFGILLRVFQGRISAYEAWMKFLLLPFKPAIGIYWFLYVMIGLYLFAPIISFWISQASKKQIEFFLGLWALNMFLPWMDLIFPDFYHQEGSYYWPFCYFGGFLGYWILGYYLRTYSPKYKSLLGVISIVGSLIYSVAIFILKGRGIDTGPYTDNLQIGSVFFILVLFMIVKGISDSSFGQRYINKYSSKLAQYSFGIYLLHIYVARDMVWPIMNSHRLYNHPILETLLIALLSISICFCIMKIITSVYKPLGKWLFGLR